jgi:hypothetical protein
MIQTIKVYLKNWKKSAKKQHILSENLHTVHKIISMHHNVLRILVYVKSEQKHLSENGENLRAGDGHTFLVCSYKC